MTNEHHMNNVTNSAKDLLLQDYQYLSDSFWKNEQTGETRVNLFIGIVTFVLGALVSLVTKSDGLGEASLRLIVIGSLSALLVLGLITMLRMLIRNENTDRYKQGLDTIRQTIKDHFDDDHMLVGYCPVGAPEEKEKERWWKRIYARLAKNREKQNGLAPKSKHTGYKEFLQGFEPRKFGGLAHTVAALNSFLLAGLVGAAYFPVQNVSQEGLQVLSLRGLFLTVVAAFILGFAIQLVYITHSDMEAKKKSRAGMCTHAGGVVYTIDNDVMKYLLVRSSKPNECKWVLPKGHIRAKEGHGEAALREVREETGIIARLLFVVDTIDFRTEEEDVTAKFYLMETLFEDERLIAKLDKARQHEWFTYEQAREQLTFPESRYILQEAVRKGVALSIPHTTNPPLVE